MLRPQRTAAVLFRDPATLIPGYFDIALRDLGLALGAFALARLSEDYDRRLR